LATALGHAHRHGLLHEESGGPALSLRGGGSGTK
jgi:hypothetical protein